jgi:hypothetical protein
LCLFSVFALSNKGAFLQDHSFKELAALRNNGMTKHRCRLPSKLFDRKSRTRTQEN